MRILLTGYSGFIAGNLFERLVQQGFQVDVLLRKTSKAPTQEGVKIIRGTSIENICRIFSENQYDGVVHLASLFIKSHNTADIDHLIESNVAFSLRLLECASANKVKWFLNTGTFWQHYQNSDYRPVNLYAATKQAFETLAQYYVETSSIIFLTLKINDTYGPGDSRPKIVNLFKKISDCSEELNMSGGDQIMDILHINDIASGFTQAIQNLNLGLYSKGSLHSRKLSSKTTPTLRELATAFETANNTTLNINWGSLPYRQREVMSPENAILPLENWEPRVSLKEGFKTV